jgi:hypothetical protein
LDEGVFVAVYCGVDADAEDVLVVLGEDAGAYDVAPWCGLALFYEDGGDDAGGAGLDCDGSCLVEDVLISNQS